MRVASAPEVAPLERWVGTAVVRGLAVVLLGTVLIALVDPRDPNIVFQRPLVVAGVVACALLVWGVLSLGRRSRRAGGPGRGSWAVALAVPVVGGLLADYVARQVSYTYGWDAAVVAGISRHQYLTGGPLTPYAAGYLSRYPFNVTLVAVDNLCRALADRLGTSMELVYIDLNAVSVALSILCAYVLVRTVRSHRAGVCAELVLVLLVGLSPWTAVPYTDLTILPFVALGLLLAVLALRSGRLGRMAVAGGLALLVLGLGSVVKSTAGAAVGAVLIVFALVALGRPRLRSVAAALVVVLVGAGLFAGSSALGRHAAYRLADVSPTELDPSAARPLTWFVAMGLSTTRTPDGRYRYGAYNGPMNDHSRRLRGRALVSFSSRALHRRLAALGVPGLARFMVDKQAFDWGDGMFSAWGEGNDRFASALLQHDAAARWVQSWDHMSGRRYLARASLTDGVWLFVLLWAGLGLLGVPYRREVALLALAVVGISVLTLLVQSRAKYLLPYVPVVVALAALVDPRVLVHRWRARRATPPPAV